MDTIKEAHYNLGIAYLEAEQYDRAVPEFEAAIKLDADFVSAHCALCRAYLEQDNLEKASTAVTAALKLDATHQPALLLCNTLTRAYYDKGKVHLNAKFYTEAVATFQKALTLRADIGQASQASDIEDKHIYAHLGAAYIGLKTYPKAIEALQSAIALDADLVDARYNLGYAYVEQGSHDKAIPHLERAIAIAPNLKRAHYNLACAYRESGNLEAATHAVTETLRLDPDYQSAQELANSIKQAHYNRGVTYLNDGRYSEAVTAFQNAITLDADFTTAHYNLGLAYLKMETYPRAVEALQKTITLDRNYKAAHHSLVLAYLGQQELGKARDAARAALELDPNYQPIRSLLEAIDPSFTPPEPPEPQAATPPESEQTAPPVQQQLAAKPKQEGHCDLGIAYKDSKMYAEAIAEFQKAIELDPDFVAAHVSLGTVYLEMERLDEAEAAANAALRIDANAQSAHHLLDAIKQARPPAPVQTEQMVPVSPATDPLDTQQDLERGKLFLNNGQYHQAAASFKRVLKVDADSMEAHYGLGQAYLEVGALEAAQTAVEEVLKQKPNHQQALELLRVIKYVKNRDKNQKIRKKVLFYAALFGIVVMGIYGVFWFEILSWPPFTSQVPDLSITVRLDEPSRNGALDAGERGWLRLTIRNNGGTAHNIRIGLEPKFIGGVDFDQPVLIAKLKKNSTKKVAVEMKAHSQAGTRTPTLKIRLSLENSGEILASEDFSLKIEGKRRR